MTTQQKRILAGGLVGLVAATAVFIPLPKHPLIVTAYLFLLLAVVVATAALWRLSLVNRETYLTTLAFPLALKASLALSVAAAVVFCALHLAGVWSMPVLWYVLLQIAVLCVTAWKLLLVGAGKEMIDAAGASTKAATGTWKLLVVDAEAALAVAAPEACREVEGVVEALRYADPVSLPEVSELEEKVRERLARLKGLAQEQKDLSGLCQEIKDAVRERAARLKALK